MELTMQEGPCTNTTLEKRGTLVLCTLHKPTRQGGADLILRFLRCFIPLVFLCLYYAETHRDKCTPLLSLPGGITAGAAMVLKLSCLPLLHKIHTIREPI